MNIWRKKRRVSSHMTCISVRRLEDATKADLRLSYRGLLKSCFLLCAGSLHNSGCHRVEIPSSYQHLGLYNCVKC